MIAVVGVVVVKGGCLESQQIELVRNSYSGADFRGGAGSWQFYFLGKIKRVHKGKVQRVGAPHSAALRNVERVCPETTRSLGTLTQEPPKAIPAQHGAVYLAASQLDLQALLSRVTFSLLSRTQMTNERVV
jgi:hypothetical protein